MLHKKDAIESNYKIETCEQLSQKNDELEGLMSEVASLLIVVRKDARLSTTQKLA